MNATIPRSSLILLPLFFGCGASGASAPSAVQGQLSLPPKGRVVLGETTLELWAETEVPAKSRRQAAFAMVDAIARGELATFIEARLRESVDDQMRVADGQLDQQLRIQSSQIASRALPPSAVLPHGWRIVDRSDGPRLHVWTRIRIPREELRQLMSETP